MKKQWGLVKTNCYFMRIQDISMNKKNNLCPFNIFWKMYLVEIILLFLLYYIIKLIVFFQVFLNYGINYLNKIRCYSEVQHLIFIPICIN